MWDFCSSRFFQRQMSKILEGLDGVVCMGKVLRRALSDIISSTPVLNLFDYNRKHRATADASQHTLGAALMQQGE